ncbi:hypothetical protein BFS06_11515 [Clostridium perfringens]|uniref:hypothetical protein n=1 Tax=Clostridium perfringens TaxID=1502 RepID=UPI00103C8CB6|nr:hypothetical protein [Clostridium perfringens]TBX14842.1 hypothetical protein BFS06_11515 [Clostridium perfringens]
MKTRELKVGDKFVLISGEWSDLKLNTVYVIKDIFYDRNNNKIYTVSFNRKNAVSMYNIYASSIDENIKFPTLDDLTTYLGIAFLNFSSVVFYDENLIKEAKKINRRG